MEEYIFMLEIHSGKFNINVYDRSSMFAPLRVIELSNLTVEDITASRMTTSVYLLTYDGESRSVYRLRLPDYQIDPTPLINELLIGKSTLNVCKDGRMIIASNEQRGKPAEIRIILPDGAMQTTLSLSLDMLQFVELDTVFMKPSGNFVLVTRDSQQRRKLIEIGESGKHVRHFLSKFSDASSANLADANGRVVVCGKGSQPELLDNDFNLLDVFDSVLIEGHFHSPCNLAYNRDRKELVQICNEETATTTPSVSVFRFTI